MAISKNFVVKNGLEVDIDTLFVDHVNRRTGVATTTPRDNLDVRGGIICTSITADNLVLTQGLEFTAAAGIATFVGLAVTNLSVSAGSTYSRIDVTERFNNTGMTSVTNFRAVGMSTHEGFLRLNQGLNVTGITTLSNRLIIGTGGTIFQTTQDGKVAVGTDTAPYRFSVVGTGDTVFYVKGNVRIDGTLDSSSVAIAGIAATSLDVTQNFTVGGITTVTGLIDGNGGAIIDNIQLGVTGDNEIDTTSGNLTIDSAGGTTTIDDNLTVTGFVNITGAGTTFTTNVDLLDDDRLRLGTGQDLQLYHDASNSYISDTGTGGLNIGSNLLTIKNAALNETQAVFTENAGVQLYYDNTKRIETVDGGVIVTGVTTSTGAITSDAGFEASRTDGTYHVFRGRTGAGAYTATILANGSATFDGDLSIADKIVHTGDTNTAIRFPAADTFTVETGGAEALRVDSSQNVLIGDTAGGVGKLSTLGTGNHISAIRHSSDTSSANVLFAKYRGSRSSPSTAADGDFLGDLAYYGYNGSSIIKGASINAVLNGTVDGSNMTTDLTFSTTSGNTNSERLRITSAGNVSIVNDSGKFTAGAGSDLQLYHDGQGKLIETTASLYLEATASGQDVYVKAADDIYLMTGGESAIYCVGDGAVKLYHNNVCTFETTSAGVLVKGPEAGQTLIEMYADEGDDNADKFRFSVGDGGPFKLQNYSTGAWTTNVEANGNGVQLYYANAKKFETLTNGISVTGNILPEADNTRDVGASGTKFANVFATTFTGALTGTATLATSFTVTANNSTNETVYPVFVDGATGTQGAETDTGLSYNPSTGLLTATAFAGSAASLTALPITITHTSYTGTAQITY